jgi:hypothetical protein
MDTTNIDSFIRAFNILLGSVGTLTELGYLVRKTSKGKTTVRSLKFPTKEERKIPRLAVTQSSITSLKQESASHAFNHTNLDLKDIPIITNESIPSAPIIKQEYSEYKQSDVDILSLFSSIKFQVLNILIEESCIKIQPLSADENEITVTFAEENLVLFRTTSNRLPKIPFELFIKGQSVQDIDWLNPWKNVTIEGSSELRDIIRSRKDIANLLSTDQIEISSNGNPNDGINITVSVEKSYEGIRIGYRIIRDFLWFLEMELAL